MATLNEILNHDSGDFGGIVFFETSKEHGYTYLGKPEFLGLGEAKFLATIAETGIKESEFNECQYLKIAPIADANNVRRHLSALEKKGLVKQTSPKQYSVTDAAKTADYKVRIFTEEDMAPYLGWC